MKGYYVYSFLDSDEMVLVVGVDGREVNVGGVGESYCCVCVWDCGAFVGVGGVVLGRKWVMEGEWWLRGVGRSYFWVGF